MHRIAIVEPTTLLGREVKETLEGRSGLAADLRLLTTRKEEYGTLTEIAGAAALVTHATPETVADLDLLLVCGELSAIGPLLDALPAGATVVLLSPDATLADGVPVVAGVNPRELERGSVLLSPHPAAVLLAHLLHPLAGLGLEQAVATVIQPTSMYGDPGIDELLEQTRGILAMAGPPAGGPFGGELAFNVLPGVTAGESVAGQTAATLEFQGPLAVEVLQGAVFHGMAVSLWIEVEGTTEPEVLEDALLSSAWIERTDTPESLGPVAAAAEAHILLGSVRADAVRPGGFWIRAVMDNLTRGGALNAVEIATAVLS